MATERPETEERARLSLVDADVHQSWVDAEELLGYLPERHREQRGLNLPGADYSNPHSVMRPDADPEGEGGPGSSPEKMIEQHVDAYDIDYCMLNGSGILGLGVAPNADYAAAVASAYNQWLADTWLEADDRFLGSMIVAPQAPERAAEEIHEWGDHPRMRQVLMSSASRDPYGKRRYWPVYEAAVEEGLPVAVHPGKEGGGVAGQPTPAGHHSTYFEWHSLLPTNYMAQITSLVAEGVFSEFPEFRFVAVEGGLAWVPHLMWRLDKNWRSLRAQVPWLEKPPSEYIREQVRFTTQPIEEPGDPEHLRSILEMMHAEETVMFSSDYPHWDNDSPEHGLPPLGEETRERIYWRNAAELYDLPADPSDL